MRLIDRYFFWQAASSFVFFTLVLTGVMWLAQSLRVIDLIINNGQSAGILLRFAVPLLPMVFSIVFPVACLAATIFMLNRAMTDSELVVVYAAGQGRLSALRAVLVFGGVVTAALAAVTIVLTPLAERQTKEMTAEVRSDIAAALIQDGRFMQPAAGLTVYIREANGAADMRGVLVHDARDADSPVTFHAERGALVKAPEGPRLVMFDGLAQRIEPGTGGLSLLRFERLGYDLSAFISDPGERSRRPSELFFMDLIRPDDAAELSPRLYGKMITEGHEQLSAPLYGFALAVVAAAGMLSGPFSRRGYLGRMVFAAGLGVGLRLSGLALKNAVAGAPELWPLMYAPPVLGSAGALWFLARGRFRAVPHSAGNAAEGAPA